MSKLHISDDLILPVDAATQTFGFIARKGAGKSYGAGKLAEELYGVGAQVVILDTVGNWFGLRLSADGNSAGLDIPVFGGLRGDIPLQETGGELVANVAVDSGRSMIIDVSQFSLTARKRFATAFGEQLWQKKKAETHPTPLMLIIEESQLIIPQFTKHEADAKMVGIYEEIIRLGRNYGIGCTMISQRPQSVNKEVLNQVECLFVLQVNGAQERKALKEWVVHNGVDVSVLDELPTLPIGTAYVWSPQWLRVFKKVKIGRKKTFDASATPKVGDKTARKSPKPIDLKELEIQMAATIEEAKANDPKELRKRIIELEKQLNKPVAKAEVVTKDVPALSPEERKRLERLIESFDDQSMRLATVLDSATKIQQTVDTARAEITFFKTMLQSRLAPPPRSVVQPPRSRPTEPVKHRPVPTDSNGTLAPVEQRILNAIAELELLGVDRPVREMVALMAGYTNLASTGYVKAIGALRTNGMVDYPDSDSIQLTAEGKSHAHYPEAPRSSEEIQNRVCSILGGKASEILHPLIDAYPNSVPRMDVANAAGYTNLASTGFVKIIGRLRTLGFIDYPDSQTMVATDVLFLK